LVKVWLLIPKCVTIMYLLIFANTLGKRKRLFPMSVPVEVGSPQSLFWVHLARTKFWFHAINRMYFDPSSFRLNFIPACNRGFVKSLS
jgi:hypothetical protein